MPRIIYCMFFLFVYYGYTQENVQKYREDQIYFSVYYNSLGDNLDNFKENEFTPNPKPIPKASFPDFDNGMSLINPKLRLLENLFSLKLSRLSPNEL